MASPVTLSGDFESAGRMLLSLRVAKAIEGAVARGAPAFMTIELAAAALFPFPLRL